jgi:hypothetical protein
MDRYRIKRLGIFSVAKMNAAVLFVIKARREYPSPSGDWDESRTAFGFVSTSTSRVIQTPV